jgi:hypothetical protein
MGFELNKLNLTSPDELFNKKQTPVPIQNNTQTIKSIPFTSEETVTDKTSLSQLFNRMPSVNIAASIPFIFADSTGNESLSGIGPAVSGSSVSAPRSISNISASHKTLNGIPSRPGDAETGSQFIERTKNMDPAKREEEILKQIQKGNIPDFLRELKEVNVSGTGADGKKHTGKIWVMPDYLAIGSNQDFVRIPMNPMTAQKIASMTGTFLPTKKIVDDVYAHADVKMVAHPMKPGAKMVTNEYYLQQNQFIEDQMKDKKATNGQLIAGHKKDVVITNKLDASPQTVAIYGWNKESGKVWQPLSTPHEDTYADYSHGIRLVAGTMEVDGVEPPDPNVASVFKDPNLAGLISDEGVIRNPKIKIR